MSTNHFHDALTRFEALLEKARGCGMNEPTAVTLATADAAGRPSVRVVLLKGADESGFAFYTNTGSRKGRDLAANPHAAMCFFWDPIMEQVRVEGRVEPVAPREADEYWATRHPESRLSAAASTQSAALADRATLERRVEALREKYPDGDVPRPEHWSGYRLIPASIEFWRGLPHRLHERTRYRLVGGQWQVGLLYP